ncbi:MAG: type VI secretion system contractile sheath small subunit [Acidobacteria bacterium]|nr:type VI secretion system contractile sheath small subunit [Acidobacteriota bacterium]
MAESVQDKLRRVRPPRVQITYDVETGGAQEKRELPFVMGVLADLAGKPAEPLPFLKDRKFVSVDQENFNDFMASLKPRVSLQVADRLSGEEGQQLNVELEFQHIDDFSPTSIIRQVEPLRQIFEARQRLNDLAAKLDGNYTLDVLLQDIATDSEQQQKIRLETQKGGE